MNKISTLAANGNGENIPTVIGIDLAKGVFALHAVNRRVKPVLLKPQLRRDQLLELLAQLRRHGSVLGCTSLGAGDDRARAYAKADGAKVRDPLSNSRQARQDRCQRCRRHLRSRTPAEHALRAN